MTESSKSMSGAQLAGGIVILSSSSAC